MFKSHGKMEETHLFCSAREGTSDGFLCVTGSAKDFFFNPLVKEVSKKRLSPLAVLT